MKDNLIGFNEAKERLEEIERAKKESIDKLMNFSSSYARELLLNGYRDRFEGIADSVADFNSPEMQF